MTEGGYRVSISTAPSDPQIEQLRQALRAYNTSLVGSGGHTPLLVMLQDANSEFAGGLFGTISYNWLYIDLLWVAEAARGKGQGTTLLHAAEREARAHGCGNVWIDTFNPQALALYERNGYVVFGELPDHPPGFTRYFLRKSLC